MKAQNQIKRALSKPEAIEYVRGLLERRRRRNVLREPS